MRDYGKVHTSFWSSSTIRDLTDDGRLLALYLMTSPHTTIVGVFRLPDGYVSEDMAWTSQRVSKAFSELFNKGFANRCETTKWVWITKHLQWNPPENPNQVKAAAKCAAQIPSECVWKRAFLRLHGPMLGFGDAFEDDGCETLVEPLLNQNQEQKQEQEQKPPKAPKGADDRFEAFWAVYPARVGKEAARKAFAKVNPDEALLEAMVSALAWQSRTDKWTKDKGAYIPNPATWLNAHRWLDEPPVTAGQPSSYNPGIEATQRLLREQAEHAAKATPPPAHILALRSRRSQEVA